MKILCLGDLHGTLPPIKQVLKKEKIELILCPGDLPYTNEWREHIFKNWSKVTNGISLEELMGKTKYKKVMLRLLKSQDPILKKLNAFKIPVLLTLGNSDISKDKKNKLYKKYYIEDLIKKYKNIKILKNSTKTFKDIQILGHSGYRDLKDKGIIKPRYPKKVKLKNKKWNDDLNKLFSKIKKDKTTIFLAHEPPFKTKLDKIGWKKSPMYGKQIGDEYYRKFLLSKKPNYMVCGHIHETFGKTRLGKTTILNSGYSPAKNFLVLDTKTKKVKFY
jgi:Icc-related predicted phosphoesterase